MHLGGRENARYRIRDRWEKIFLKNKWTCFDNPLDCDENCGNVYEKIGHKIIISEVEWLYM